MSATKPLCKKCRIVHTANAGRRCDKCLVPGPIVFNLPKQLPATASEKKSRNT